MICWGGEEIIAFWTTHTEVHHLDLWDGIEKKDVRYNNQVFTEAKKIELCVITSYSIHYTKLYENSCAIFSPYASTAILTMSVTCVSGPYTSIQSPSLSAASLISLRPFS